MEFYVIYVAESTSAPYCEAWCSMLFKKLQAHYKELANKRNLHEKDKQEFLKYI
jgi:hypothetical protein